MSVSADGQSDLGNGLAHKVRHATHRSRSGARSIFALNSVPGVCQRRTTLASNATGAGVGSVVRVADRVGRISEYEEDDPCSARGPATTSGSRSATGADDASASSTSQPRKTGLPAAREITLRRPQVRVLMLSMHDNEQYLLDAISAGASGYVLKSAVDRDLVACRGAMWGAVPVPGRRSRADARPRTTHPLRDPSRADHRLTPEACRAMHASSSS